MGVYCQSPLRSPPGPAPCAEGLRKTWVLLSPGPSLCGQVRLSSQRHIYEALSQERQKYAKWFGNEGGLRRLLEVCSVCEPGSPLPTWVFSCLFLLFCFFPHPTFSSINWRGPCCLVSLKPCGEMPFCSQPRERHVAPGGPGQEESDPAPRGAF